MANQLRLRTCHGFNFTSLNINELFKRETCFPQQLTLNYYDEIPEELEANLHVMLKAVREMQRHLTVAMVRGPADWGNKESIIAHLTVPPDQSGAWGIIYPNYKELSDK